jgi:hypothetical protein
MTADDVLMKSLASAPRLTHAGRLAEVEPASLTKGGLVAAYRVRVRSSAELLERRGLLSWRQGRAARRLQRAYVLGILGARDPERASGAWSPAGLTDAQLGAAEDFRLARLACPPASWDIVFGVAVLDQTIAELMAERHLTSGRASGQLMTRLKTGLNALADLYDQD